MCRVAPHEPRGGGDRTLRAVVVVALLVLAASALQARRGLEWDAISDPVEVQWVRVMAAVLLLLVLAQLARPLLKRLRRRRRGGQRPAGDDDGPAGEPLPWWLRVLAAVFVLAGIYAAWLLLSSLLPDVQRTDPALRSTDPRGDTARPIDVGGSWLPLLLAGAVLLVVAAASRVRTARQQAARRDPADDESDEAARLEAAVVAAQDQLAAHTDARAAIVAAYAAMAASLSAGLARLGAPGAATRPSDTPTELLTRAVRSGLVSPGPATTLTELFREARFSRHPMGPEQRRAAEGALALVRSELPGAVRA